jgi:dienelactone hydrolase
MAETVLFHHALGRTPGVDDFAESLRSAGHGVVVADLFDGRRFDTVEAGVAYAETVGFDTIADRGSGAASGLPAGFVPIGMSLGNLPTMKLAQTDQRVGGAVFLHGGVPLGFFGGGWPEGLPLQAHTNREDDWGDLDVLEDLRRSIPSMELFTYDGSTHLFTDSSTPDHDRSSTGLVLERVLDLLAGR